MFSKSSNFLLSLVLLFLTIQPFVVHSENLKSEKEYFKNFQNLKDSIQEGHTVEGLSEVKKYLQNYGYYPSDISELSENFDETLTSALQTYQKYHHLNVTGTLDFATVQQMMVPRCGCPDIVKHKHLPNTGKLHMVSHYTFFNGMPRWPYFDLTYRLSGPLPSNPQVLREVCSRAFGRWSAVSRFRFQEVAATSRAHISIGFYRGNHGDGANFDGPGQTLAHAFAPTVGEFHYDADERWSINPSANEVDLESVTIHEIGHLLGLDHSQDLNAIMYPSIPFGVQKRFIGQDDVNGIYALYPLN